MFAAGFPEHRLDHERWSINLRRILADVEPSSARAIAVGLICVFGALLFRFVLQIPVPVLKFLGWSTV